MGECVVLRCVLGCYYTDSVATYAHVFGFLLVATAAGTVVVVVVVSAAVACSLLLAGRQWIRVVVAHVLLGRV